MKAEDTIQEIPKCSIIFSPNELRDEFKKQAQVSFKAGIKEVVDWGNEICDIKEHNIIRIPPR